MIEIPDAEFGVAGSGLAFGQQSLASFLAEADTTGKPPGVVSSHRGACLNAFGEIFHNHFTSASVYLWTLPMFHCNGWCTPWAVTAGGATHVCLRAVRPDSVWGAIDTLGGCGSAGRACGAFRPLHFRFMVLSVIGAGLLLLGTAAVVTGLLPWTDLLVLVDRVAPILVFVVAMTVVTELCSEAGVFRWIARRLRHWGNGRAWLLWLWVAGIAIVTTLFLSLDTTAVLLTPVVVVVARQAGLPPLPFALTTVWLANTGSLLLPISNLTNLLAQNRLGGISPVAFAGLTAAPALVAVIVPTAMVALVFRKDLGKRYSSVPVQRTRVAGTSGAVASVDRVLLGTSALVLAAVLPALVVGLPVWLPSSIAALVLAAVFFARRRSVLRITLVPWSLLLFSAGLFLAMEALQKLGLPVLLTALAGAGNAPGDLFRLAGTSLVGSNLINNLPAYLALEPVANSTPRLLAVLIGANVGPLITPWASLATLLWHSRLEKMNVLISWRGYALFGLVLAPVTVGLSVLTMILVTA